jgi:hypothetical protein
MANDAVMATERNGSPEENDAVMKTGEESPPTMQWTDVPLDIWSLSIFPFVGSHQYRFVGGVCRGFQQAYRQLYPEKVTKFNVSSYDLGKICFDEIPDRRLAPCNRSHVINAVGMQRCATMPCRKEIYCYLNGCGASVVQIIAAVVIALLLEI